jgi:hypothetical protein
MASFHDLSIENDRLVIISYGEECFHTLQYSKIVGLKDIGNLVFTILNVIISKS